MMINIYLSGRISNIKVKPSFASLLILLGCGGVGDGDKKYRKYPKQK